MSLAFDPPDSLPQSFANIQVVATDMDGTLTRQGHFSADLIHALEQLQEAGIAVIIVTGRSSGWVQSVVNYLPVWGAIAENGGIFFSSPDHQQILPDISNVNHHRNQLRQTFQQCQVRFPKLHESTDNPFRITDWTFDVHGLSMDELNELRHQAEADQWSFTYSTVQCHIKPPGQSKAGALKHVLTNYFPSIAQTSVITVGDSPNDESLFDVQVFPYSVGVANIQHYLEHLQHKPTYITQNPEVSGFCELVRSLLR